MVEIKQHKVSDDEELLISNQLISYKSHLIRNPRAIRRCLEETAEEFNKAYSQLGYLAKNRGPTNYAIFIPGWPKDIRYEFNDWLNINQISIEIELNLEAENLKPLIGQLKTYQSFKITSCGRIKWCPHRSKFARIAFLYNADYNPTVIAQAMKELIEKTQTDITSTLEKII